MPLEQIFLEILEKVGIDSIDTEANYNYVESELLKILKELRRRT